MSEKRNSLQHFFSSVFLIILILLIPFCIIYFFLFVGAWVDRFPNQKKFDMEIQEIADTKIWEMKNMRNTYYTFEVKYYFMLDTVPATKEKLEEILFRYFELNKGWFINRFTSEISNGYTPSPDRPYFKIKFYRKSKKLPTYYAEKFGDDWTPKDLIEDHENDHLATIELNDEYGIHRIIICNDIF